MAGTVQKIDGTVTGTIQSLDGTIAGKLSSELNTVTGTLSTGPVGTTDYNKLDNKPSIENVILQGNKTIDQIGVKTATVQEIEAILYLP